jgi:NADH-quinone oxidoreductase subunit G
MSAQPTNQTAPDLVNIEIDGKALQAPKGSMIIQAADKAGVAVPRFCYHEKLPIAANCRMCMVDVEKMPKPAPACATPVMEGMKIYTQSKRALDAQRNVMEFLLINHPLDCPICDQGGECELQDLSLGYGRSVSRYNERKRVVADENLGPLVSSDMTRCIQCTRCIRVSSEICGTFELGGMQRGERLEIGTYDGKPLTSELSGNVIDVCPVGALTNKVFRFRARAWDLLARQSIGYHDALGSNLYLHVRRGEVLRSVPRDNEAINECWLSDRDRYSHQGLYAPDRLSTPLLKDNGSWREASWSDALARAASLLKAQAGEQLGVLVHPATSNEEGALLARLAAALGCANIDHRLRAIDLADAPAAVPFAASVQALASAPAVLLVGSNIRHELPLVHQRLHQAVKRGARVFALNPVDFPLTFALAGKRIVAPSQLPAALASVAKAAGAVLPAPLADLGSIDESAQRIADALKAAPGTVIVLGELAENHAQASWLRALAEALVAATGAVLNRVPGGANAVGLSAYGVLPTALDARAMLASPRAAYVVYGAEPPHDFADGGATMRALAGAQVVAFSAFAPASLRDVADVILPIALLPEMDASLTNLDGIEQRTQAGGKPPGEARPGWRVLRALGEQLALPGFTFTDLAQLRASLAAQAPIDGNGLAAAPVHSNDGLERITSTPIYRADAVLRRATALNAHPLTTGARAVLNPEDALAAGINAGAAVRVGDNTGTATVPAAIDVAVPRGCVWLESGYDATAPLSAAAALSVTRA